MDHKDYQEAGGFIFIHNFDSGNLGHVERVPSELILSSLNHRTNALEKPDFEFNVWTRPDCAGTEFENGNRTWFYFGVQGGQTTALVRLNVINLNKQGKMYNQGMAPVTRTLPGQPHWERIRDRPVHSTDDNGFILTFKYRTPDNIKATTFFAFTYPFSFTELQMSLSTVDHKLLPLPQHPQWDDIYYCRENIINTLEGRRTDLLTISSYYGIMSEREERLKNCFPDNNQRPFKFANKKVIFVSARVHPGETPSSFVFNGFLNLLLNKTDPIAIQLRKHYVFKMIPFLNPDGVARGHYRTDTRGVNLNRVYLNPTLEQHPTVYAARALIRCKEPLSENLIRDCINVSYHHFGLEKEDNLDEMRSDCPSFPRSMTCVSEEPIVMNKKPPYVKSKDKRVARSSPSPARSTKTPAASKSIHTSTRSRSASIVTVKKESSNSGDTLADQVCDLKLQEIKLDRLPAGTKPESPSSNNNCPEIPRISLLDDVVVRDCLGSEVHLSRSDEFSCMPGPNPLRQLRDTLKNSISLLMGNIPYPPSVEDSETARRDARWTCDYGDVFNNCDDDASRDELDPSLVNSPDMSKCIAEELTNPNVFCMTSYKTNDGSDVSSDIKIYDSSEAVSVGDRSRASSQHYASQEPTADSNGDNAEKSKTPGKLHKKPNNIKPPPAVDGKHAKDPESGLFLYVDLHGHASKKGIFMYGNHFEEMESSVECMLLPRIMSLNNLHFHFSSCNFTERNMYLRDRRDGMSREGSGRVAVLKATGLVRSYTLECNYNTGRLVNVLPPAAREISSSSPVITPPTPPKYTPHIFEEVGRSLGASILDLTGQHPNSRIPGSEHRSLSAVRDWLRAHMRTARPQLNAPRLRSKTTSPTRAPLYSRTVTKNKIVDVERKENTYIGAKSEGEPKKLPPLSTGRSSDVVGDRYTGSKKNEKAYGTGSRSRCSSENEPKAKSLSAKRRNVLAIRKPNAGKGRSVKPKTIAVRRAPDEAGLARPSISKVSKGSNVLSKGSNVPSVRSFRREGAASRAESGRCKALSSSSLEELVGGSWGEVASASAAPPAGKRRPYPPPLAPRLKKIRLKTTS